MARKPPAPAELDDATLDDEIRALTTKVERLRVAFGRSRAVVTGESLAKARARLGDLRTERTLRRPSTQAQ